MNVLRATVLFLGLIGSASSMAMTLTSTDIREGTPMDKRFVARTRGCGGENRSPQLMWSDAPRRTKSFAITVFDPDAKTDSGFWHWSVVNIPNHIRMLAQGADPERMGATMISNDSGSPEFSGACPPKGEGMHRYVFTVWALPVAKLILPRNATPARVSFLLNEMAIDKAKLTSTYFH